MNQDNPQLAQYLTKAIGYTENDGAPNLSHPSEGKTGELASIFQFEPATWQNYSKQVFGKEVPMTPDTETKVVMTKVQDQLKHYSPEQILSMWNAGPGEPDAYTGKFSDGSPSVGVNKKYGVKYDVPGYVKKGMDYLNEFMGKQSQSNKPASPLDSVVSMMKQASTTPSDQMAEVQPNPEAQKSSQGLLGRLLNKKPASSPVNNTA